MRVEIQKRMTREVVFIETSRPEYTELIDYIKKFREEPENNTEVMARAFERSHLATHKPGMFCSYPCNKQL